MSALPWLPIGDIPGGVRYAIVFDPENLIDHDRGPSPWVEDLRVCCARRTAAGVWRYDHPHGGWDLNPTHFIRPNVPDGFPADPPLA